MKNAIEVRGLTKKYDGFTLDNVSFDLPEGCIMGLIGENGAGKSTTIRLIMDAIKRDAGSVMVLGCDNESDAFRDIKEDIGVVLDEAYFPEYITPAFADKMMALTYKRWDSAKYNGYIDEFRLPRDKQFKDFSRGMKMKLAIAVALSHDPKLLILDEATSGLDPIIRDEILDMFNEFTREPDHSILLSSHIVSDLEKICDYIAFIHKGRLIFCEEKDALLDEYAMVKCAGEQVDDLPEEALIGAKYGKYGAECLVRRDMVSEAFEMERAGIEDIMLYMVKGDGLK